MTQDSRKTGCVKWFNSVRGYGFITNIDDINGKDLFVHHTALTTGNNIYKSLTPGEYINYDENVENNKYFAINVTGIKGGKLLCEHRQLNKDNKDNKE